MPTTRLDQNDGQTCLPIYYLYEAYDQNTNPRYLTDLYGTEIGRMKLSQIMGCLVELRELCEKSQNEQENIRL